MILKKLCGRAFTKSLWIYHVNTGSCNGCDIEIVDVITPFYDAERFGIKLAGSPGCSSSPGSPCRPRR